MYFISVTKVKCCCMSHYHKVELPERVSDILIIQFHSSWFIDLHVEAQGRPLSGQVPQPSIGMFISDEEPNFPLIGRW